MGLRKLSQTFRICMALMLSVLTSGILQAAPVYAVQETCSNTTFTELAGGWVKTESLSSTTFEVPQIAGFTVTQICYKASNEVVFPAVSATVTSTVTNNQGVVQNLSHVSVFYTPTTTVIALPAAPSVTDPCGAGNATWNLPADTATLNWDLTAGVLTVSIIPANTTFPGGATTHNFGLAVETNVTACVTVIDLPAAPSITDPCGTGNATWDLPADTATLNWDLTAGVLTVSIIPADTTFPGGATTHNFGLAVETNVAACVDVISLPTAPSVTDPCGAGNATWDLPADTATLDWSLSAGGELSVTILTANTTFPGGATTHNFGLAVETNVEECEEEDRKVEICHATSAVVNPYNKIEVSTNAADGIAGNSGGQADHFDEHDGPIFNPATDVNGGDWGDIIPPIAGAHDGLNWTAQGQAIFNNDDCVFVPLTTTDACPLVPGVQTDTTLCPPGRGGQVLGETTGGQTLSVSTEQLPESLPATGAEDVMNPFMAILASLIAYGATYFLQGRRQLRSVLES